MNKIPSKSVGSEEERPRTAGPDNAPTPTFVLRRKLVYVHSFSLTALFILAVFYTLFFLRDIVVPIAIAFVLYLLLSPILRALERVRVPTTLAAAVVTLGFIALLASIAYLLVLPVAEWLPRIPGVMNEFVDRLELLKKPVEKLAAASRDVETVTNVGRDASTTEVIVRDGSLLERLTGNVTATSAQALLVMVLLYFLLATGAIFREKLIKVMPTFGDKRRAFTITYEIQRQISRYLLAVTLINLCLGAAVAVALWCVSMPSPILWGTLAAVLNFLPYVGAVLGIGVVGVVAVISYDSLSSAIIPPVIYFALTSLEGQIVTPSILGRRLTLNPLVLFVSVVFWGWMWGVAGALLAVPFIVILKVICDNIESVAPIGEFLGGKNPGSAS